MRIQFRLLTIHKDIYSVDGRFLDAIVGHTLIGTGLVPIGDLQPKVPLVLHQPLCDSRGMHSPPRDDRVWYSSGIAGDLYEGAQAETHVAVGIRGDSWWDYKEQ